MRFKVNVIKEGVKKFLLPFLLLNLSFPAIAAMQYQEELADFQASLYFLRFNCQVELTDEQFEQITFNYIYQRRLFFDYIDNVAQEKLNVERYRDLMSIDIPEEKKCEELKNSFASSLDAVKNSKSKALN